MTPEKAMERLQEAIEQMKTAAEALDQAHAMMRDLKLHNYVETGCGPYRQTLSSAYGIVEGLQKDMETLACMDCGQPMNAECLAGRCPSLQEVCALRHSGDVVACAGLPAEVTQ